MECEKKELIRIETDRAKYLHEAMTSYLHALQAGDYDQTVVHRVASLFMQNKSDPFLKTLIPVSFFC